MNPVTCLLSCWRAKGSKERTKVDVESNQSDGCLISNRTNGYRNVLVKAGKD